MRLVDCATINVASHFFFLNKARCQHDYPHIEKNLQNSKSLISSDGILIEEKTKLSVPGWIKSAASWWIAGQATDNTFIEGLEYIHI